jgi:predicted ester cyclase
VEHLVASGATFTAPTTFPECHTPLDYADSHAKVMSALNDLHITSFDVIHAKGGFVALRYSAEGIHKGTAHNGIEPTGKHAKWTAAALFEVEGGKIRSFTKEWDKLHMWRQLGWMRGDEYV